MGTSRSSSEFAGKIRKAGQNLKAVEKTAVQSGARVAERVFTTTRDSMHAGGRNPITVRVRSTESNGHPAMSVKFGPNDGWVAIKEGRVGPHFIGPKGAGSGGSLRKQNTMRGSARAKRMAVASLFGGTVGAGTKRALFIPGIGFRAYAHHKGIHKKKPVAKVAMAAAPPLVKKEMALKATTAFAQPFK